MSLLNREILKETALLASKKTHGLEASTLNWPPESNAKPRGRAVRLLNQTPIPSTNNNNNSINPNFQTLDSREQKLTAEANNMWHAQNSAMGKLQQKTDDFHYSPAKKKVTGIRSDVVDTKSGQGNVIVHEPLEIRAKRRRGNQNEETTQKIFSAFEQEQAKKERQFALYENGNFHKDFSQQPPLHKGTAHVPPPWKMPSSSFQLQQQQQQDDLPPLQGSPYSGGGGRNSRNNNNKNNNNSAHFSPDRELAIARLAEKFEHYTGDSALNNNNNNNNSLSSSSAKKGYSPPGLAGVGEVDAVRNRAGGKVQFRNYHQLTTLVEDKNNAGNNNQQQQQQQQQQQSVHQRIPDGSRGLRTNSRQSQRGDQVAATFETNPSPLNRNTGAWLTTSASIGNVDGSSTELKEFVAGSVRGGLNTRHFLPPSYSTNPVGAPKVSGYFRSRTPNTNNNNNNNKF